MDFPAGRFATGQGAREHWVGGRYRLVERLGRGGMGSVWQAFDERLQRTVAVKVLDPAQSDADQGRVEALALAQLNHPHIANVFDYGDDQGRPYLVMEMVRGHSLAAILTGGPLGWSAACAAVAHVASALAAAHERGVVHRDVKPGNIMVTPVGAKLIDFGISAVEGETEADANGGFRGTPVYVAPERLHGHPVAAPADVYALGLVLYLALSGRLPWGTGDTAEYWTEREHSDPTPLPPTAGLPPDVADLCLQCLTAEPTGRPDAANIAVVLAEAAGPGGVRELELLAASRDRDRMGEATQLMAPVSTRDAKRGRRAVTTKVGATAAVVAAVLAVWSTSHWSPGSDDAIPGSINAAGPTGPDQTACDVTFQLAADDGQRFAANIVATPRTESFPSGWRLSLPLPAIGINVDLASGWRQEGAMLTSPAQPTLGVGSPSQLALSGSHTGAIALPTSIDIDGRDCAVVLLTSTTVAGPPPEANGSDQVSDNDAFPDAARTPPGRAATPPNPRPEAPGHANGAGNGQAADDD